MKKESPFYVIEASHMLNFTGYEVKYVSSGVFY